MSKRIKPLDPLYGEQRTASDPRELVWLSASAGTGKTQVLSARVLRLLLNGAKPESILCLTFTKAGAAEMAERIHERLAHWAGVKDDSKLRLDLTRLGEDIDDDTLGNARRLFAQVLEAPGGGLRIQTIHAFCQTLLGAFPSEAGLIPGFRPLEAREEAALARRTLADMLAQAEHGGDLSLIRDVQALSRRLGEGRAESYLVDCARAPDAMAGLGSREGIEPRLRRALRAPLGDVEAAIEAACAELDLDCFHCVARANRSWGRDSGLEDADIIAAFIAASPKQRTAMLKPVVFVAVTRKFEPRQHRAGLLKAEPLYAEHCARLAAQVMEIIGKRDRAELAAALAAGLRAGQSYAAAYVQAKRIAGVVDFDDLIRKAVELLATPGMGDWVRFKLDRATDHILVDEAQDTNTRQWAIVRHLAAEYFAGRGAKGGALRTIFTVGDFKQAIFGFQGTDPLAFEWARRRFTEDAEAYSESLEGHEKRFFQHLSLDRSFRSTPPILALVDRVIADLGSDQFGLFDETEPHQSARNGLPGVVTLLKPHVDDDGADLGEEDWIGDAARAYADRLARQVRAWLDTPLWLAAKGRTVRPEDILILVRRRAELASLIVARLHAQGVPVAGVDRLRLTAPLGVRDLLAAVRVAVQREDDLSLASLLVSPLFGWSQDELYRVAHGRRGPLIAAVRAKGDPNSVAALDDILNRADFSTPYRFLEHILTGPLNGRRKLLERLGQEARDPVEELLNAALQFESVATASLQRFLDWFDRGDVEITRDPSAPMDAVRVMTVHGSKGLQAPLVILADATGDPELAPVSKLDWTIEEGSDPVPIPRPRKTEMVDELRGDADQLKAREMAEHWRLLYVALTRAEEHLVIGGALGSRGIPEKSWFRAVELAMDGLGVDWMEDPIWTLARHYRGEETSGGSRKAARPRGIAPVLAEPQWLRRAAAQEARPPRPLAPSAIGTDDVADPPPGPAMRQAARRGTLLHALFERLPPIAPADRAAAADRWLHRAAGIEDAALRHELAGAACGIIADPQFSDIFGPASLAEAPIAAVVGGDVVAGTVDRLLVTPEHILLIDFKTGRHVPSDIAGVPQHHLAQMGAYAAALATIFPGRRIDAALLYTSGPKLIELPQALLAAHKPGFSAEEQMQGIGG